MVASLSLSFATNDHYRCQRRRRRKILDFSVASIQSQVLACFYMVLKTRHGTSQAIHRNGFDSCGQAARDTQPLNIIEP